MKSDYLWDKSEPRDPDVESLERTLGALRHRGVAPQLPARTPEPRSRSRVWAAAAAIATIVLGAVYISRITVGSSDFLVTTVDGAPDMCSNPGDPQTHEPVSGSSPWTIGDWLVTDADSTARVQLATIGEMTVSAGSQIRLVHSHATEHRFALQEGEIRAHVNAPPRLFVVETPTATAYDLGCEYSLRVADDGRGQLHVTSGWVEMRAGEQRTVVPADAFCQTNPGHGPGLTWVDGAPGDLVEAIADFDVDPSDDHAWAVLEAARARDSITLWHLIQRTDGEVREAVFARLHAQVPSEVRHADDLNAFLLETWLFAVLDEFWIVEKPEETRQNF